MSKRRRTSSIASRGQDDDFEDSMEAPPSVSTGPTGRKRKKLDPQELCQQIYDTIRNHKKEDGTLLCDAFIRVPKRRQEPSYYEVVSNPIDLLKVQQKLKTDEYEDMEDLTTDIELLVSNAKAFYKRNSQEYRDACDFWELFVSTKNKLLDIEENESKGKIILKVGKLARRAAAAAEARKQDIDLAEDTSESSTNPDDDINQFEDLFTAVMMATDADNRPLHTEFQLLPSKKKYPEYYEVIEQPIDLKIIATKIQNGEYSTLTELEKDLMLMTKNACLFNEPGSQIYKDAKALKKKLLQVISTKKTEVEHGKFVSGKSSERIRNKRLRGVQSLSAVTAALKDEETDTDADEPMDVEEEVEDSENPQWQLFDSVKSTTNNTGMPISEPFWKLPSKRYYPDYYKEIKNPISLSQIKKKIKKGDYGTVSEVAGDMNIMFENAKKYNIHTSKLYKDAVRLQKVMQSKVQELLDIDQVTHTATNRAHKVKDTDSDADSEDSRRRKGPKGRLSGTPAGRGRATKEVLPLKKRLHMVCKCLIEYTCEDGRQPMLVFMEKPSKKLYPDYYQVIQEPIDLLSIESKIKNEQYNSEEELISDFKLMFANCRQYNEEHSTIYEDANILEKVLMDKVKEMTPVVVEKKNIFKIVKPPKRILTIPEQKCRTLYDAIRDYREPKNNRQLALIFMKLPSKNDYPDYYEVIKSPIDMEKISHKLKTFMYSTLEELVSDFILMFDNACKYNEPDSQIYKDALILQRVCLQTKLQLCEDEESVPDVQGAVQDMLSSLFTSVYNHQDEEGRCYSDSMAELPEHDEIDGKKIRALSLDLIKRRLDRSLYRRLDSFQEDFFTCLERARRLSRTDSQVFEDSVELQTYFIQQRDEICRNGDWFSSPALSYTLMHLTAAVQATKQNKLLQESLEDENETSRNSDDSMKESNPNPGESMTCNQQTYRVGEFVYLEAKEKGVEPSIVRIERLWTNNGQQMLYGKFFFRPGETYHVATRKFLEKEVFMSDTHIAAPLDEIRERCCVMNIKDYIKLKPEGYAERNVYVCESRYSTKSRSFKKILKIWPPDSELVLVPREQLLELRRVMSVFRERIEKHKDELAELEEQEKIIEKEKPNVVVFTTNVDLTADEGSTYYEQYNTICSGVVKTGDCVYVATDGGRQLIAQIDTIWDTKDGKAYFRGPWLVTPPEIPHSPNRLFYKQEVFLSTLEDTNPLVGIVGKCAVLDYNDYISSRPTEIPEVDIYICESVYDEVARQIRKLSPEGLKKYAHSNAVTEDEIYYFRRLINPPKIGSDIAQLQPEIIKPPTTQTLIEVEASPLLTKITGDVDILMEDSLDGGPPSVSSGDIPAPVGVVAGTSMATPVSSKKKQTKRNLVTGYILYSSEVRKQVAQNNPESTFGEISRIVGNEWRSLPAGEKQAWEERAAKCNEENAAKLGNDPEQNCPSPAPILQLAPLPDQIYECLWSECDYQFEEITDCIDHCIQEGVGHVQMHFQNIPSSEAEYQCHWKGCGRLKKSMPPFPSLVRLARHVREVHINKGNGKIVPPGDRSKNFVSSSRHQYTATVKPTVGTMPIGGTPAAPAVQIKPQEPLFISVPPRPQRVLHSEAYIKYIEGLQSDNKFISPWEKTLTSAVENTPQPDLEKLAVPSAWLANGAGQHGSILNALWSLRDYMVKDSLNLYKNL